MSRQEQQDDSLGGLARRWLKTQLRMNGDPIQSRRQNDEAREVEQQIHEKVEGDAASAVVSALMPESWKRNIERLERANEEGRLQRAQQQRAEHESRQRVPVRLSLAGGVNGTIETLVPIRVDQPAEPGEPMTIDLEPLEPLEIGGHTFIALLLAIPEYSGAGTYDLTEIEQRTQLDGWDPLWFQLTIDTTDDGLYWTSDYGPASVTVDETTIHLQMPMSNANGLNVQVDARITLSQQL